MKGDEDVFIYKIMIGLPPSLLKLFLTSPSKDPASLAIAFQLLTMPTYDEDHKDDQTARQKILKNWKHIIQFCWLADDKQILPLTKALVRSKGSLFYLEVLLMMNFCFL